MNGVESLLLVIHAGIAGAFGAPELMLGETEAKALAQASANVARHYSLGASQKMLDWGALAVVAFSTYAPKMASLRARIASEKQNAPQAPQSRPVAPTNGAVTLDPAFTPMPMGRPM